MSLAMDVQQQQMRGMAMRGDITMRTRPGAAMAANLTMLMDGSAVATIREILVNNVAYLSGPSDFLPVSSGKRWTAVPAATLDQASGSSRASATDISLPQLTPTSLSGTFFASINAAKDVSVAGPQVIDGVPTTRLHGTYRDQGSVTTFDLWVDAQARPRELRESVSTDDANQGGMTLTVHFRSFNMPVSITPPPARDVGSMQLG